MRKQGFLLSIYIILLESIGICQPLPPEAIYMEQTTLSQELQGIYLLNQIRPDKDGRLFTHNARYIFRIGTGEAKPFAGQGLRGIPDKITSLYANQDSTLWAIDDKSFYYFDFLKQTFIQRPAHVDGGTFQLHDWLSGCWNQYLLFSAGKGKFYCIDTSGKAPVLKVKLPENEAGPYRVFQMDAHNVMLTSGKHWYILKQNGTLKRIISFNKTEEAQSVSLLKNGWLFIWSRSAILYSFHLETGKLKKYKIGESLARPLGNFRFNGHEYAALGGPDSLYLINPDSTNYTTWKNTNRQQGHKMQPAFGRPFQDGAGSIWIPNDKGIARFETPERITQPLLIYYKRLDTMMVNQFQEPKYIQPSHFHPWVLFTAGNQLHIVDTVQKQIRQTAILPARNSLSFTQLNELDKDRWVVGTKQGLFIFHLSSNRFEPILFKQQPLPNVKYTILKDSIFISDTNDSLFTASLNNLNKLNRLSNFPNEIESLSSFKNQILIAHTTAGLFKRTTDGVWKIILPPAALTASQWISAMPAINETKGEVMLYTEGTLWITDIHSGTLTKKMKLISPGIAYKASKIFMINENNIGIVSRNSPIAIVNIENGKFYSLGMQQGWWGQWMGAQADISKGNKNDWWASFDGGIIHYDQHWLLTPPNAPYAPSIDNILIQFEKHPLPPSFYQNTPLEVSYKKGAISFEMSAFPKDSIEYSFPPFDKSWHKGSIATFTNLPGGTYTFITRMAGAYESYSPEKKILIKILPPFWKTMWFRVLASMVLAGLAYLSFRMRLHQQNKKNLQRLQIAQSELKAIRSQMNPHFIFNCMTAIDALIATGQTQKASSYLAKFSKLMRQVLQLSEKQLISLDDEINTLKLYLQLEQLRMQDNFSFTLDITEGLEHEVEIPPLLLQPFVENAIIHGLKNSSKDKKHINIKAEKLENRIIFIIEDNGVGRSESAKNTMTRKHHNSMGTRLTDERLKMMEHILPLKTNYFYQDLFEQNNIPAGTKVTIELTYRNNHV